jgi:hypothetical protein
MRALAARGGNVRVVSAVRVLAFLASATLLVGCAPGDLPADESAPSGDGRADVSTTAPVATVPALDPGARSFEFTSADLDGLLVRRNDLGSGWSVSSTAAENAAAGKVSAPSVAALNDACLSAALGRFNPALEDAGSLDVVGPDLEAEVVFVSSGASAFWSEEYAAAQFEALAQDDARRCLLKSFESQTIQFAGEEGFYVLNPASEVLADVVPYRYGTVLLFSFTLSDGRGEDIPLEYAFVLVGKGSVLVNAVVVGFGDYDASFVVPMVAKMVARVEALDPDGTPITR